MKIVGIGVDIIQNSRIKKAIKNKASYIALGAFFSTKTKKATSN